MKIGTKSVLWGYHAFWLHPLFVAWGWTKLYGFPWDPRLWVAFFVHDLGYWGKPNIDGPEGEEHVNFGSSVMHKLFDTERNYWRWYKFTRYHSRFWCKRAFNHPPSPLCYADKLAFSLYPTWLIWFLYSLTGEGVEIIRCGKHDYGTVELWEWIERGREYNRVWVANTQANNGKDVWTKLPNNT